MRKGATVGLLPCLVMVVAACAGGADSEPAPAASAVPNVDIDVQTSSPAAVEPSVDAPAAGERTVTATVTIGGTNWEFSGTTADLSGNCTIELDGWFVAAANTPGVGFLDVSLAPDGYAAPSLDPLLPPPERVSSYISVSGANMGDPQWSASAANSNVEPGLSQVDSYDFSQAGASGTASFIDMNSLSAEGIATESAKGDFTITCG